VYHLLMAPTGEPLGAPPRLQCGVRVRIDAV